MVFPAHTHPRHSLLHGPMSCPTEVRQQSMTCWHRPTTGTYCVLAMSDSQVGEDVILDYSYSLADLLQHSLGRKPEE